MKVHYVGTLRGELGLFDGSTFYSSRDSPGAVEFTRGKGQVISGLEMAVATMLKGEVAELYCRADYAYGELGRGDKIPPCATLKYEVELLWWADAAAVAEHEAVKARLRDYEVAFEREHGTKPRKRRDWAPVIDEYERYASLREEEKAAVLAASVEPSPGGTRDA